VCDVFVECFLFVFFSLLLKDDISTFVAFAGLVGSPLILCVLLFF